MRHLAIILLIILTNCKSDTKTESQTKNGIDKSVYDMWSNYTASHPEFQTDELPESWYFHNYEDDANRLAELILNSKKQAGSGLYTWYKDANAALPKTGVKHIITDFNGKAKAIIEIRKVDTVPFNQITKEYAELDMGTTIEPLKKWKKAHWDFFATTLEQNGDTPTEDMLIVCEQFKTIWPE
ncbi:ASCH domain-containing protein [Winogradskyella sp. F6397]|uniref:ASCH domain-containing protein n=1 Tax=Winogradskyella marina TaxID=2785530 RepID=A0ABS0EGZ5_9FLAO|nr:ASCH domain-containing protein [Winogradskyella marina]MBF8149714.1 ASCH domain-containing protein [Winogradskyella marina]